MGKEWYRFPSHFFLPSDNWRVKFVKSEFKGQLPQMYADDVDATKLKRSNFNDLNQEETDRYVKVSFLMLIWFLVLKSNDFYPYRMYSQNVTFWLTTKMGKKVTLNPFTRTKSSNGKRNLVQNFWTRPDLINYIELFTCHLPGMKALVSLETTFCYGI